MGSKLDKEPDRISNKIDEVKNNLLAVYKSMKHEKKESLET